LETRQHPGNLTFEQGGGGAVVGDITFLTRKNPAGAAFSQESLSLQG